jgi:Asp-tRNA(Asn)/Glu-tRNA(Gln) amidotransferase A subunit family amidase
MVPLAVGTETDGSIVCPAAINGVVGIKPTLGRVSQQGIIPIASSQDTAGPMARTVHGAAMLLDALRVDGEDTTAAENFRRDLKGVRIGVWRGYSGAGSHAGVEAAFSNWLEWLVDAGGVIVDPLPLSLPNGLGSSEFDVLLYEFNDGIDRYLEQVRDGPNSLAALIEFNQANADVAMPYFGQEILLMATGRDDLESNAYAAALAGSRDAVRAALANVFDSLDLDVIVAPANAPAWPTNPTEGDESGLSSSSLAAVSGYPSIVVPGGLVDGLPVALAFVGKWNEDAALVSIASVFESLRPPLPAPAFAVSR